MIRGFAVKDLERLRQRPTHRDVLGSKYIICLECGAAARTLPAHLRVHDLNGAAYRERWGYDAEQPLVCGRVSAKLRRQRLNESPRARSRRLTAARRGGFLPQPGSPTGEKHPKARKDVRTAEIIRLAGEGLSMTAIARRLNCSRPTVANRMKALGVRVPRRRLSLTGEQLRQAREKGLTVQAMADRFHCSVQVVLRRLREAGVGPFDVHDKYPHVKPDEVAAARRKGMNFPQLVAKFRCGVPALIYKLRQAGARIQIRPDDAGTQRQRGARNRQVNVPSILHLLAEGLTVPQVAATLRCCANVVRNRLSAAGLIPTHEEKRHGRRPDVTVEAVRACLQEGLSWKATARRLKCSYALVRSRLAELEARGEA